MKLIIGATFLILIFSASAFGQSFGTYGYIGSGPSLNSGASLNSRSGFTGVGTHTLYSTPEPRFHMTVVNGSSNDFIPSTFVPFEQAVAQGRAALATKPKTLAEVAAEYRATKKPKAEVAFVQDDSGRAIKQQQ